MAAVAAAAAATPRATAEKLQVRAPLERVKASPTSLAWWRRRKTTATRS